MLTICRKRVDCRTPCSSRAIVANLNAELFKEPGQAAHTSVCGWEEKNMSVVRDYNKLQFLCQYTPKQLPELLGFLSYNCCTEKSGTHKEQEKVVMQKSEPLVVQNRVFLVGIKV